MSLQKSQKNKSIVALALISTIASVLFSFMSAPFLRSFSISAKSRVFWLTATVLVGALFVAGLSDSRISETAVYVGAIWMTLGSYNELEKRGVNWRSASFFSLSTGLLFALAGYFLILRNLGPTDRLTELVAPLNETLNREFPQLGATVEVLKMLLPGIICASLLGTLAIGFVFEARVAKLFNLKRERIASGLRWLEFSLPSSAIWITLSAMLLLSLGLDGSWMLIACMNTLIVLAVAFFFQGMTIVEFMLRFYRLGVFTRTITYILIIIQLAPFVAFVGFVDYWAEFRKLVRKKTKAA